MQDSSYHLPESNLTENHLPDPRPSVSIYKLVPSMLTLMALIAGVTSIQMAINGKYEMAINLIVAAAILDILDGAVARALKAQSDFGAELDSLSDFLAFGIAPSIVLYVWVLDQAGKLGWIATVILPVAAALRLARFNVAAKVPDDKPLWKKRYFTGVPSPAGAGLALLPVYIWLMFENNFFRDFAVANWLIAVWTIIVSALMVSRIPTFSIKYMKLPARMQVPVMAFITLVLAALFHAPWITLTILATLYAVSIPIIFVRYRKQEKKYGKQEDLSSLAFGMSAEDVLIPDVPVEDEDDSVRPF